MKKIKLLLGTVLLCTTLISCKELQSLLQIINCSYVLDGVVSPTVAGVSLSSITNPSQLKATDLIKVGLAFTNKNFPLNVTFNVKATNPGTVDATVHKLDWAMDLDQKEMLQGSIDQIISIPSGGGSAIIPFTVQTDLLKLFGTETQDNLLNLALNIANVGDSSSKVSLRVRPTISMGGQPLSTGFITLSKTVSSK